MASRLENRMGFEKWEYNSIHKFLKWYLVKFPQRLLVLPVELIDCLKYTPRDKSIPRIVRDFATFISKLRYHTEQKVKYPIIFKEQIFVLPKSNPRNYAQGTVPVVVKQFWASIH